MLDAVLALGLFVVEPSDALGMVECAGCHRFVG